MAWPRYSSVELVTMGLRLKVRVSGQRTWSSYLGLDPANSHQWGACASAGLIPKVSRQPQGHCRGEEHAQHTGEQGCS